MSQALSSLAIILVFELPIDMKPTIYNSTKDKGRVHTYTCRFKTEEEVKERQPRIEAGTLDESREQKERDEMRIREGREGSNRNKERREHLKSLRQCTFSPV
jgi:hypothetical protein